MFFDVFGVDLVVEPSFFSSIFKGVLIGLTNKTKTVCFCNCLDVWSGLSGKKPVEQVFWDYCKVVIIMWSRHVKAQQIFLFYRCFDWVKR